MSLLKAFDLVIEEPRSYDELEADFLDVLEESRDDPDKDTVVALLGLYATYSCKYLVDVATTLREPPEVSQSMKFMNSYVAEVVHKAGLHYYDRERSKSVVDLAMQKALDNGGFVSRKVMFDLLDEVEDSYIEFEEHLIPEEYEDASIN